MVFPTKLRRVGGDEAAAAGDRAVPAADAGPPSSHPAINGGKCVALSGEQTQDLNFPVGCPVWYNFAAVGGGARVDVRVGVVQSVELDIFSKTLVFKVLGRNSSTVDTVLEGDIAYAINCPVVLSSAVEGNEPSQKLDGEILFSKPVRGENGTEISYVVRIIRGVEASGNRLSIEEGVKPGRLRYRAMRSAPEERSVEAKEGTQRSVSPTALVEEPTDPSEVSVEDGASMDNSKKSERSKKAFKPHANRHKGDQTKRPRNSSSYQYHHRRQDRPTARTSYHYEGRRSYQPDDRSYNGKRHKGENRGATKRSRDKEYAFADASRKECKRKPEETEKAQEMRMRWEQPHSWRENDGAI